MSLFICTDGCISGELDGQHWELQRGDAFVLAPANYAKTYAKSEDFKALGIRLDYEFYLQTVDPVLNINTQLHLAKNPKVHLNKQNFELVQKLFTGLSFQIEKENAVIADELTSEMDELKLKLIHYQTLSIGKVFAYIVLEMLLDTIGTTTSRVTRKDEIVRLFLQLMQENYPTHRDVAFYAEKLFLTTRYLSVLVKEKSGKSPQKWIAERVINHAKQRLAYTNTSIKEIAQELNFGNQSFFGKYFKQHTGISPKEFRDGYK